MLQNYSREEWNKYSRDLKGFSLFNGWHSGLQQRPRGAQSTSQESNGTITVRKCHTISVYPYWSSLCTNWKEALAITRACQKFSDYILGHKFTIETDHKPLIPLLNTSKTSRCTTSLRFPFLPLSGQVWLHCSAHTRKTALYRRRSIPYSYSTNWRYFYWPRSPIVCRQCYWVLSTCNKGETGGVQGTRSGVCVCTSVLYEWPREKFISQEILPYYKAGNSLTVRNGLLLFKRRIVVPK